MNYKYNNIVIPIDLAHESSWRSALPVAIDHARRHEATLHVVTIVANAEIPAVAAHLPRGLDERVRKEGLNALNGLIDQLVPPDVMAEASAARCGRR